MNINVCECQLKTFHPRYRRGCILQVVPSGTRKALLYESHPLSDVN